MIGKLVSFMGMFLMVAAQGIRYRDNSHRSRDNPLWKNLFGALKRPFANPSCGLPPVWPDSQQ